MEFLRAKEIKGYCLLETVCFSHRSVSLAFSVLYIFGPRATLSSFMPARQGKFVRDTLGLVLGKCCKVPGKVHSVTKQAWLHITVGNITYV